MLKTNDFKIKQTPKGYYSVYRVYDERSQCLRSHIKDTREAANYIERLLGR